MKLIFTFILFLFFEFAFHAQTISGKITSINQEQLDYCKLTLYMDSTAIQTVFIDSSGYYFFEKVEPGEYSIRLIAPFKRMDTLLIVNGATIFNLKINFDQDVKEIVVSVKKPKVVQLVDRTVFDPSTIPILKGGSALDVIEFAPGVFVKAGNIVLANGTTCMLCLLYTSPSPRDGLLSRMPSSA